jgi:hypothetical protein
VKKQKVEKEKFLLCKFNNSLPCELSESRSNNELKNVRQLINVV